MLLHKSLLRLKKSNRLLTVDQSGITSNPSIPKELRDPDYSSIDGGEEREVESYKMEDEEEEDDYSDYDLRLYDTSVMGDLPPSASDASSIQSFASMESIRGISLGDISAHNSSKSSSSSNSGSDTGHSSSSSSSSSYSSSSSNPSTPPSTPPSSHPSSPSSSSSSSSDEEEESDTETDNTSSNSSSDDEIFDPTLVLLVVDRGRFR